ncbi:MAG: ABC transporter permease [Oscillospiraceae bacterium]
MLNIITGAISLGLLWSIMALGVYMSYRILDYADLTVEGSIATGAVIAAKLIVSGTNPFTATFAALLGGMAAGALTGLLNTKLKIPGILSGILSMIALYSINIRILGKANVTLLKSKTLFTMAAQIKLSVGVCGGIIALTCVFLLYKFLSTSMGNAVRATGNNEQMSKAMGINTDGMKILGLAISNGLVALSGALIAQNQCFADLQMGQGAIVIGLASVIISEVMFRGSTLIKRLFNVVLGAVAYRAIIAFVIEMGMNPLDLKLFTAITVAAALSLPKLKAWLYTTFVKRYSKVFHIKISRKSKQNVKEGLI